MLRMKHKDHGFTHAYTVTEEATLRANGWIGEDESFSGEEVAASADQPKRRGRPPKVVADGT